MKFASKLRKLRTDHRLSQEELAQQIDVSQNLVSLWERGVGSPPDIYEALKLARALSTDLTYLADDALDNPPARDADLLGADERFVLQLYRDLNLGRAETVRRLYECPEASTAPPHPGPMRVIGDRDLSHLREDEGGKGKDNRGKNGNGGGKAGGPSPRE